MSRQAGCPAHLCPAVVAPVDVLEFQAGLVQVAHQRDVTQGSQLAALLAPVARDGVADASEHDVARDRIEFQAASRGQERKALLDLTLDLAASASQQRAEPRS